MPIDLGYEDAGTGVAVVLIHAFPLSRAMFAAQVAGLADRARIVAPDLRGLGTSPGPGEDQPSIDTMADDVAALLDRLDLGPAVVAGVSMGGYVAMAMLRRHPDRVGGVVLMDTKASADDAPARENRERVAAAVLDNGPRALRPMLDGLLGQTTRSDRPEVVETVTRWLDAARPDGVAWAQRAMAGRPDSFGTLAAARVPAFVVVGEEDTLTTHDDALAMAAAFARPAPVHVIPRAGHLSAVENPDEVTGALRDVLRHF
ncbi:MAG TPA: alpha/beta hydrolase [Jiangellaceae bacterium]|nr:alpha/beta hydrolase [Jiangellaceae bacterium]